MRSEIKEDRTVDEKEDFLGFFIVLFIILSASAVCQIFSYSIEKWLIEVFSQLKF